MFKIDYNEDREQEYLQHGAMEDFLEEFYINRRGEDLSDTLRSAYDKVEMVCLKQLNELIAVIKEKHWTSATFLAHVIVEKLSRELVSSPFLEGIVGEGHAAESIVKLLDKNIDTFRVSFDIFSKYEMREEMQNAILVLHKSISSIYPKGCDHLVKSKNSKFENVHHTFRGLRNQIAHGRTLSKKCEAMSSCLFLIQWFKLIDILFSKHSLSLKDSKLRKKMKNLERLVLKKGKQ